MTKAALIYDSHHHHNTEKLVTAIKDRFPITLIDAAHPTETDLTPYDIIGFASGIYYGKFSGRVMEFAENHLPLEKNIFFLYTYGKDAPAKYTKAMKEIIISKDCDLLGIYSCPGLDTFGLLKLIGGINKTRPNQEDIDKAIAFCQPLLQPQED